MTIMTETEAIKVLSNLANSEDVTDHEKDAIAEAVTALLLVEDLNKADLEDNPAIFAALYARLEEE